MLSAGDLSRGARWGKFLSTYCNSERESLWDSFGITWTSLVTIDVRWVLGFMRIGVFGGSFDPVHVGHLWIAEASIESLRLDSLRWIPTATSPLKPGGGIASDERRLQMLRLAVSGVEGQVVDDREIRRGEVSYTFDTITQLCEEFPEAEIFLIIGSDSLASMQKWHRPADLLQIATLSVVQRGGEADIDFAVLDGLATADRINCFREAVVRMPVIEISSSEIRDRVAAQRSIRYRVPHPVAALIENESLYRG